MRNFCIVRNVRWTMMDRNSVKYYIEDQSWGHRRWCIGRDWDECDKRLLHIFILKYLYKLPCEWISMHSRKWPWGKLCNKNYNKKNSMEIHVKYSEMGSAAQSHGNAIREFLKTIKKKKTHKNIFSKHWKIICRWIISRMF